MERKFVHLKGQLAENRYQSVVSADGVRLQLLANINNLADVQEAVAMGAEGAGLCRSICRIRLFWMKKSNWRTTAT